MAAARLRAAAALAADRSQATVSLGDQSLCGYITREGSIQLPAGMTVRYAGEHPDVVSADLDGTGIDAVGTGPAVITATVRCRGRVATGRFVVEVR